jgi:hypothetical protein
MAGECDAAGAAATGADMVCSFSAATSVFTFFEDDEGAELSLCCTVEFAVVASNVVAAAT